MVAGNWVVTVYPAEKNTEDFRLELAQQGYTKCRANETLPFTYAQAEVPDGTKKNRIWKDSSGTFFVCFRED